MKYKLSDRALKKIILEEIKSLSEYGMGREEEDTCPEGMVWNEELGECVEKSEGLDPVHQERPDAGEGWEPEELDDLAQELEKMGFVRR